MHNNLLSYFFVKTNTSESVHRVCYGRVDESVNQSVSQSVSESCMYFTPIKLDLL